MIKNFDDIKKQLKELAEVVNGFKSEAVQLRIIDLVFGYEGNTEEEIPVVSQTKKRSTKKKKASKTAKKTAKKSGNRPSGQGAIATLTNLVDGSFFNKPKTIANIIEHCDHNLARKFKANEFSGKLSRLVRDGGLMRSKNKDGQYEYIKAK